MLKHLSCDEMIIDPVDLVLLARSRGVRHGCRETLGVLHQSLAQLVASNVGRSYQHDWTLQGKEVSKFCKMINSKDVIYLEIRSWMVEDNFLVGLNFILVEHKAYDE